MVLTGAGQMGMATARRMDYGIKTAIGDKKPANTERKEYFYPSFGYNPPPAGHVISKRVQEAGNGINMDKNI